MSEQTNQLLAEVARVTADAEKVKEPSPEVEKMKEAMRASKQLLGRTLQIDARTAPVLRGLEIIERELQRTHSTLQILAANKCAIVEQIEFLNDIREDFRDGVQAYLEVLKNALKDTEQN